MGLKFGFLSFLTAVYLFLLEMVILHYFTWLLSFAISWSQYFTSHKSVPKLSPRPPEGRRTCWLGPAEPSNKEHDCDTVWHCVTQCETNFWMDSMSLSVGLGGLVAFLQDVTDPYRYGHETIDSWIEDDRSHFKHRHTPILSASNLSFTT